MASKCPDTSLGISIRLDVPGGDYYLTPFREDDIQANYELMSQDAILDELIGVPKPAALLPIPTVSERNGAFFSPSPLACAQIPLQVIRHGSTMIGSCGLSLASYSPQRVEVGYWLSPAYHGQRIMYAACRALLRYAANEWGVRCVEGRADGGNERSARIIARLAWEARGAAEGEVQCVMGVEKWPENKKGGGERVVRRWDWTVEPEEGCSPLTLPPERLSTLTSIERLTDPISAGGGRVSPTPLPRPSEISKRPLAEDSDQRVAPERPSSSESLQTPPVPYPALHRH
ncbi:hypothetical protein JHW43_007307 [Diplocarpon mali]|nr:hypothetical protein JHW43_007307 [Diplocarpon mali]